MSGWLTALSVAGQVLTFVSGVIDLVITIRNRRRETADPVSPQEQAE